MRFAGDGDLSAVGIYDGFANCQSKTCLTLCARPGFICAIETFENVRHVFGGNPLAVVGNGEEHAAIIAACGYANLTTLFIELNGIRQKVDGYLSETLCVTLALNYRKIARYSNSFLVGNRTNHLDAVAEHLSKIDSVALHAFLSGIETC